jgi:Cu(I)/Ag(I) efflux system membrane fusion protein
MKTISVPAMVILPPESRSEVSTQIPGNVRSIWVTPGQRVKRGDVLLEISGTELQSLQLDLLKSSLEAQLFRNRFERLDAAKTDAISRKNLIETLAKAEQLESRVTSLRNQLATLGIAESSIQELMATKKIIPTLAVRASIDGFVSQFNATLGESISAGQRLIEIQNLDQIWIEASFPVDQANDIALDAIGHVHALVSPETNFEATVARIGPVVDAGTRVRNAWLVSDSIPTSLQLREGMLMNVLFRTQPLESQLAVANLALIRDGLHWFVFVQSDNGSLERRQVTRGRSDDTLTQILNGLAPGEFVVVSGSRLLQTAFAALR